MSHLRYFSRVMLLAFLALAVFLSLHFFSRVPGGDYGSRANGAARESILDLSDKASAPPGTYELSVWVHTLDGEGEELPSDRVCFNQPVEIHS